MNTDLTTAALENIASQLGLAIFNDPGMSLMEIANRRAEIEAMARDAGRYRWLCDGNGYFMEEEGLCHRDNEKPQADEVIDQAMKEQAE